MYLYHDYLRKTAAITIALSLVLLTSVASAHAQFGPVTDLGPGIEPHIATGLSGTLHIVYHRDNMVRYRTMQGSTLSSEESITGSTGGRNPYVGVGVDGSVHVVWDTWHTAYYTNRVGGSWKNPQALPKVMSERNLYTQVAVASNGNAFTSHWSLTKYEGGYNLFSRVTNTGSSTPTITQVYVETAHNRPPSIIGPTPVSAGTGNIHILIGLIQTRHWIMDQNGGVTGGQNISRTPHEKTAEGLSGYFVGTDPGVAVAWWSGSQTQIAGAVVNTLSRANANQVGLVAGQDCGEFPFPRAVYDPVQNKVYVLYPRHSRPSLASWVPQQSTVQQLGDLTTGGVSTNPRGPGAGGIAVAAGGGVHIVYSTGGWLYHRTADGEPDTEPPSVPTDVQATALSWSSISITWSASTDNVGVAGYKVFRNGVEVGTSGTTSYTDTGLEPSTTYSYTVSAYDATGNESAQSTPPAVATTHPPDTEPPSVPTEVSAEAQSSSSIVVSWTASTDNVGVEGYKVFRHGSYVGTSPTTSYADIGLSPDTTYSYTVSAYDAAGNESAQSTPPAVATTLQMGAGWQWLWLADNHTVVGDRSYESMWVDGTNKMATAITGGNWDAQWDVFAPGVATVLNPDGSNGRYLMRTNFVGVDDPSDPAKYWDANEGVTLAAKVYIPSVDEAASGNGSILLGLRNPSTANLAGGHNGFRLWWGWDYAEDTICAGVWNAGGTRLRGWIVPTTQIADVWSTWTVSAKRHGDTILWNLWINGVHHGADMLGPDGNYHTYVGFDHELPSVSYIYFGQRRTQPFTHKSHWDYVGITNAGVVPGWDGISPVADSEPPSIPANVQATVETPRQIKVTWNESTDNVGVTGYKVFRNGTEVGTSAYTSYIDTSLTPGTSYSYTVSAYDGAGNNSGQSSPAAVVATMSAIDIATAKQLANGATVGLVSQAVTALFDDYLYVGEIDRHTGIRVVPLEMRDGINIGSAVDVGGTLQTVDGERCIEEAVVSLNEG